MSGLPEGMAVCPGWIPEFGAIKGKPIECGRSTASSRKAEPSLVRIVNGDGTPNPCTRCRKAKKNWDDKAGGEEARAAERKRQVLERLDLYVDDLRLEMTKRHGPADGTERSISDVLDALDAIEERASYPPFAKRSEGGGFYRRAEPLGSATKLQILRRAAGKDVTISDVR